MNHVHINCRACESYRFCKAIEDRHREDLAANGGNWRAVYHEGKRVTSPLRRCSHAAVARHVTKFRNKRMLEIGCGPASEITGDFCDERNTSYVGLDPERLPAKHIRYDLMKSLFTRWAVLWWLRGAKNLRYRNLRQTFVKDNFPCEKLKGEKFELIYGNSTIEHWHEDDEDVAQYLKRYQSEILASNRLLHPGGCLLMNCPLFVHGNCIFMKGIVDTIESIFGSEWSSIVFEHWREIHDDLLPYCPKKRKLAFKERFNIDLENMWLLNVVAVK